jgi:hypothetical protein
MTYGIYRSDTHITNLTSHGNTELAKMARWFRVSKMVVNLEKKNFIFFLTRGKQFNNNDVRIFFDDNGPNQNKPTLIIKLERIHQNHENKDKHAYKLLGSTLKIISP